MLRRVIIAALLAIAPACGCASLSEESVSLVAQKPVRGGWPWKRTQPVRVRSEGFSETASRAKSSASESLSKAKADPSSDRFLIALPDELRSRIETELAEATREERQRLLAYFATVEPSRIPSMLDARRKQLTPAPTAQPSEVVTAAATGTPTFELSADDLADGQVQPASAQSADPPPTVAPIARPRRNPLIEIQGVEFDDSAAPSTPDVVAAAREQPAAEIEQSPEASPFFESPIPSEVTPPPAAPTTSNPLARLKEWTTIRKPEPATTEPPAQTAQVPTDLSLQGLGRRLRGSGTKLETASLPQDPPPLASGESPHLQEGIQRLISLMEAETARLNPGTSFAQREEYVRRHAELRMLYLMSRQPTLALQAIPEADVETQEFWTSMMWSLSNYFDNDSIADPTERAAQSLDRLRAAEQHLQATARLELRSLAFCDKIEGFGAYHPFENDVFRPGQPVLLYAEVRNFKTDVTAAGRYRTSLKSTIEIIKSGDESELIERRHFESTEDQSRSPRTDYFHSYKLDLPLHITPGSYALRLSLEDELSGKIGTSTVEFLVR